MNGAIAGFIRKELAQTLRDPVMRFFLFGAPLVQLTLFGLAISNEYKNLKLAVVMQPGDVMMRELSEKFYSSGWFNYAAPSHEPQETLRSGAADAVLIAPAGGLAAAFERTQAQVQLLIDASNATKARAVERYASSIVRTFYASRLPNPPVNPIVFDLRILYNPTLETSYFMVPGVMTMVIALIAVMLTGMSMAREKEMGTLETIIAAPLSNTTIVLGKTIPFVVLAMVDAILVIAAGMIIFAVPMRGFPPAALAASFVFVCTMVSIGVLISTFAATQQQAMMGSFLFIFPANLLSGIMFPVESMPLALRFLAYANPLKYFASVLRNTMLKGTTPQLFFPDIAAMTLLLAITIFITIKAFRSRI
ncbi:MAG: hypothetical protein A2219_04920 [Elusimicrobia bacterium RIFOXYA2_FULL_50_26]|nr:MAG: hypothetical protein A2219_04920 [Elusimicrobia bacterium RIFOXYA2_FULL_50_26]